MSFTFDYFYHLLNFFFYFFLAVVENLKCFSEIEKGGPDDECVRRLDSQEVAKYTEAFEKEGLFDSFDDDDDDDDDDHNHEITQNKKECT